MDHPGGNVVVQEEHWAWRDQFHTLVFMDLLCELRRHITSLNTTFLICKRMIVSPVQLNLSVVRVKGGAAAISLSMYLVGKCGVLE